MLRDQCPVVNFTFVGEMAALIICDLGCGKSRTDTFILGLVFLMTSVLVRCVRRIVLALI